MFTTIGGGVMVGLPALRHIKNATAAKNQFTPTSPETTYACQFVSSGGIETGGGGGGVGKTGSWKLLFQFASGFSDTTSIANAVAGTGAKVAEGDAGTGVGVGVEEGEAVAVDVTLGEGVAVGARVGVDWRVAADVGEEDSIGVMR